MNVIEVEKVYKLYSLGERQPYYSLRDSIVRIFKNPLKKNKKIDFLSLNNVSFSVREGEVLGIIGSNGAGKSTLLKVISQITPPTRGKITLRGRVASLLEVGTGFHPELTGKENIFFNGAILGMSRAEIKRKYEDILNFSEISQFIDTPVKHYSSGMYMRLAFSVAAHLDSEILLVDEVLAVGDAKFQRKCIGKMHDVSKSGRTVLFVSHNMSAVQSLCDRCILMSKGKILRVGQTSKIISEYLKVVGETSQISLKDRKDRQGNGKVRARNIYFRDKNGHETNFFRSGEDANIWIDIESSDSTIKKMDFALGIDDFVTQNRIAFISNKILNKSIPIDSQTIKVKINKFPLTPGRYQFTIIFVSQGGEILDWVQRAGTFNVEFGDFYKTGQIPPQHDGSLLMEYQIS